LIIINNEVGKKNYHLAIQWVYTHFRIEFYLLHRAITANTVLFLAKLSQLIRSLYVVTCRD